MLAQWLGCSRPPCKCTMRHMHRKCRLLGNKPFDDVVQLFLALEPPHSWSPC